MAIYSDAGALVGTWWNQVTQAQSSGTTTETTVNPATLTARTDLDEAQQALGQPLPVVIGTGRVDGVYFIGGVVTVATVTWTTTTTNDIPEGYQAVSGTMGGQTFLFGPGPTTTTTSVTEYDNRTLAGYVLAYDVFERGYNLIRLEIDGAVVYDGENDIAETTTFRFYGGRHTTVDPILTEIIGTNPGAYQNFVMVFIDGYPADSPPSISAIISNATDSTPVGGIIEWTGPPPTTGPFPPGVGTNYPHGAAYDPARRVIYQIIDATDVVGLTHVYLATLDVDTRIELYRVPLEGSESFAYGGDYQLSYPIVMQGTGFVLVHLISAFVPYVTAVYEASTGRLVASHVDTVDTLWREVMQFGTAWVFFAANSGGQAAIVDIGAETIGVSPIGTGMSVQLVTRGRTTTGSVSFFIVEVVSSSYDIHEAVYDGTWTVRHVIAPAGTGSPVLAVVPVIWFDPLTGYFIFQDTLPGPVSRFKYVNPDTGAVVDTFDVASNDYFNVHNLVPPLRFTSEPGFMLAQELSAGNNIDLLDIQAKTFTRYISDLVASDYTRFCRIIVDQTQNLYATAEQSGGATSAADHWTVWRVVNVNPRLIDLEDIITDSMSLAGFGPPDLTFEGIAGRTSYGFVIASDTTVQTVGRALSDIYGFSWCDTGSGFYFKQAAQGDLFAIDAAFDTPDIVERDQPVMSQDEANIRTPSMVEMQYVSKEGQYKARPASFNMTTGVLNSITTPKFSTPILFNDAEAQRIVQEKFFEFQEKRRSHTLAVAPENITLLPGDIVSFPSGTRTYITRVEEVGIDLRNMGVEIFARDFQTDVESPITAVSNTGPVWQVVHRASGNVTGQTLAVSVGAVTVTAGSAGAGFANVTGQTLAVSVGAVTVTAASGTAVSASVTGQAATGSVGVVTVSAGAAPNTTWSTTDKFGVTLSGSDLIATGNSDTTSSGMNWVRAASAHSTGKFYFELTMTSWVGGNTAPAVTNATAGLYHWAAAGLLALYNNGTMYLSGSGVASGFTGIANGAVVCIAVDAAAALAWVRVGAAGQWNGSTNGNPAAGTGGVSIASIGSNFFPAATFTTANDRVTANFGGTAFVGTVPSGFTAGWPV